MEEMEETEETTEHEYIKVDEIIFNIRNATFHHSDEEAKPVIDGYIEKHPELLKYHSKEWYYKYC